MKINLLLKHDLKFLKKLNLDTVLQFILSKSDEDVKRIADINANELYKLAKKFEIDLGADLSYLNEQIDCETTLTQRTPEFLDLFKKGNSIDEIAQKLHVGKSEVKSVISIIAVKILIELYPNINKIVYYDEIDFLHNPFSNYDYFAAKQEGKYGVIDHDGNEILPFIYDRIEPNVTNHELNRQLAVVSKNKKFGVVDLNNNMIIPFEYEEIGILSDESLCVKKNNQIKIVDFSLKQVCDTKFQYIRLRNNEGCFCAIKDNMYGAIDKMGKTVIDFKYDYMCPLDKGFFVAQQGEKNNQGIIDKDDNIVTAFKYNFSKNVICRERSIIKAKIGSKYGLINYATGEVVLDFIYDEMHNSYTEDKCIFVRQGEKEFCFNPKGDLIPF